MMDQRLVGKYEAGNRSPEVLERLLKGREDYIKILKQRIDHLRETMTEFRREQGYCYKRITDQSRIIKKYNMLKKIDKWEEKMKQKFEFEKHYRDSDGNPAGGDTKAVGLNISWQNGPLKLPTGRLEPNGAFVETVLQAAFNRLEFYETSKFSCEENRIAMRHIQDALKTLEKRTQSREEQGVEGTHQVHMSDVPEIPPAIVKEAVEAMVKAVSDKPKEEEHVDQPKRPSGEDSKERGRETKPLDSADQGSVKHSPRPVSSRKAE